MVSLYLWMLLLLLRQNWVSGDSDCSEWIQGSAVRGKDVTLTVRNGTFTRIDWIIIPGVRNIATTRPGRDPDLDFSSPLRGRLASTPNGSLIIRQLHPGDQRRYRANMDTGNDSIPVCYDLRVYEELSESDIIITPNITSKEPCEVALTGSVEGKIVTNITWTRANSSDLNVTGNTLLVSSSHIYSNFTCTASNPVSNASKTVRPQQYCGKERNTEQGGGTARLESNASNPGVIAGVVAVIIVLPVVFLVIRKRKRKKETLKVEQGKKPLQAEGETPVTNSNQGNGPVKEHVSEDTKTAIESCYDKVNYSRVKEPVSEDTKTAIESCYDKVNYSRIHGPEAVAAPAEPSYQTVNRAQSETPQQNGGVKAAENPGSLYSQIQYTKGKNVPNPTQPTKEEYYDDNKTIYEKVK